MITKQEYQLLKAKIIIFDAWLKANKSNPDGSISYSPHEVPEAISRVSNQQRSSVEVYEFVHFPPQKYLFYIRRIVCAPGVVDNQVEATTWTGQILGKGYLGRPYLCGRPQSRRYPVTIKGINNKLYRGTYYVSAGDYAIVKAVK